MYYRVNISSNPASALEDIPIRRSQLSEASQNLRVANDDPASTVCTRVGQTTLLVHNKSGVGCNRFVGVHAEVSDSRKDDSFQRRFSVD